MGKNRDNESLTRHQFCRMEPSSLNAELLQNLRCPGCYTYMTGNIYGCRKGHSMCDTCSNSDSCPSCDDLISTQRNFPLENISRIVRYPCENHIRGCDGLLKMEEIAEHSLYCNYRIYSCKVEKGCTWQGTRSMLKGHGLKTHEHNVLIGHERILLWGLNKPDNVSYLMLAYDEMFYVHRTLKDGIMYWAVQYIGRSEDVNLYCFQFQLQIFTDQFRNRKLVFSEICHDDVKDIDDIIDTGFCIAVPLNVLDTYIDTQGVIFYKIKIMRA